MKKKWASILTCCLFGLSAYSTQIPIPSTPDSLEHFLEIHTDMYANGDTILLTDPSYVVNGTPDLYHGVTIMGDPSLITPPMVQFLDNGFRLKQDSTSVIIKGLSLNGYNDDKTHRAGFILRMDNIPASDSIFYNMKIEDVDAVGFKGGIDLHQLKHAQYDSIIVNNVIWHDFSGEYCVDPNINFSGYVLITNSTFYDITHGFLKNPDFASDKNNYTKIAKQFVIDHNTIYNLGGVNNSLIQVNDPKDSTVTLTFTNNIVQKLYDPNNVRPFRIDPSAGTFDFDYNAIYDFMPTNPDKDQFSLDSTDANQTNVTVTHAYIADPKMIGNGNFNFPLGSGLLTAGSDDGQIGDPRWTAVEGVVLYDLKNVDSTNRVYTNSTAQVEAWISVAGGDQTINWTVAGGYAGTSGAATINAAGLLSPTAAGQVKVTATSNANGALSDTLIVSIVDSIHVSAVVVSAPSSTINTRGGVLEMTASISPKDATETSLTWSVSDENIATIEATTDTIATLTAVANGIVTVTATALDGGIKGTMDITVSNQTTPVDSVVLSIQGGASDTISTIGVTVQLIATIYPADAYNKGVQWSAAPAGLATVVNGLVTAVAEGTVTITVTADDGGSTDQKDIVIKVPVSGIHDNLSDQIKVFPNPANDYITINVTQQAVVTIHNIAGDIMMEQTIEVGGSVYINELANGVYIVNVSIGDQVSILRFVKE